jgi:hypothetical protein
MPVKFGVLITSVNYNRETRVLTVDGEAFGINLYPACQIGYKQSGTGVWNFATITSWSDTQVVGSLPVIAGGWYDVRITSADNEYSNESLNAFQNPSAALFFFFQRSK